MAEALLDVHVAGVDAVGELERPLTEWIHPGQLFFGQADVLEQNILETMIRAIEDHGGDGSIMTCGDEGGGCAGADADDADAPGVYVGSLAKQIDGGFHVARLFEAEGGSGEPAGGDGRRMGAGEDKGAGDQRYDERGKKQAVKDCPDESIKAGAEFDLEVHAPPENVPGEDLAEQGKHEKHRPQAVIPTLLARRAVQLEIPIHDRAFHGISLKKPCNNFSLQSTSAPGGDDMGR